MNYKQLVESIVDELLEIRSVNLATPNVSKNVMLGAKYGKAIDVARFQGMERGIPGADNLSIEYGSPEEGGVLGIESSIPTNQAEMMSGRANIVADKTGTTALITVPPARKDTGGNPVQAAVLSHEVGHFLSGHLTPEYMDQHDPNDLRGQVETERAATKEGVSFARHIGMPLDTTLDRPALDSYRRAAGMPPLRKTPKEKRYTDAFFRSMVTYQIKRVMRQQPDIMTTPEQKRMKAAERSEDVRRQLGFPSVINLKKKKP